MSQNSSHSSNSNFSHYNCNIDNLSYENKQHKHSPHSISRRDLVKYGVGASLGTLLPLQGCSVISKELIIPIILGEIFHEVVESTKIYFANVYKAGEFFESKNNQSQQQVIKGTKVTKDNHYLSQLFKSKGADDYFKTPIFVHKKGQTRFLQLQETQLASGWSLCSGGNNNNLVFKIHNQWLNWLINEDNCALQIYGF